MSKQMCQGPIQPVKAAPNRFSLKTFGGTMTIEQFRSYGDATGTIRFTLPDEYHKEIPKCEIRTSVNTDVSKMQHIQDSSTTNETLKLKRPRPLKRDENNLEKSLGIVRKKGVI